MSLPVRNRWVAAATGAVLSVGALTACDAGGGPPAAGPEETASEPDQPASGRTDRSPRARSTSPQGAALARVPAVPTTRDPRVLAGHLTAVTSVVHDPDAGPADLERAGEFEQVAARLLAHAPEAFRRAVLERLGPRARARTRAHVEAATLLEAMGSPEPTLPDWRIVAPPPPEVLLSHYRYAARRIGVPWHYLAAIHLVETRMGRIRGVSSAGALGPMQFLPTTWDLYGGGGDINDPRDAIMAAARLLKANGAPGDMARAVWHYNPSDNYVGAVTRYAEQLANDPLVYRSYWHWRVLYRHVRGTYVLGPGYPTVRARLLP